MNTEAMRRSSRTSWPSSSSMEMGSPLLGTVRPCSAACALPAQRATDSSTAAATQTLERTRIIASTLEALLFDLITTGNVNNLLTVAMAGAQADQAAHLGVPGVGVATHGVHLLQRLVLGREALELFLVLGQAAQADGERARFGRAHV